MYNIISRRTRNKVYKLYTANSTETGRCCLWMNLILLRPVFNVCFDDQNSLLGWVSGVVLPSLPGQESSGMSTGASGDH